MKDTTRISDKYDYLASEIEAIPDGNYQTMHLYCNKRNRVESAILHGDTAVVIKHFKRPGWLNALVYGHLRASKADRSYDNAVRLTQLGIPTPEPIAVLTRPDGFRFADSWYICKHIDTISMLAHLPNDALPQLETLLTTSAELKAFIDAAIDFFHKGVYPLDFNRGNFLCKKHDDGHFSFPIVDLNRMRFCKVTPYMVARAFELFTDGVSVPALRSIVLHIGKALGYSTTDCEKDLHRFLKELPRKQRRRSLKRKLKKVLHKTK